MRQALEWLCSAYQRILRVGDTSKTVHVDVQPSSSGKREAGQVARIASCLTGHCHGLPLFYLFCFEFVMLLGPSRVSNLEGKLADRVGILLEWNVDWRFSVETRIVELAVPGQGCPQ